MMKRMRASLLRRCAWPSKQTVSGSFSGPALLGRRFSSHFAALTSGAGSSGSSPEPRGRASSKAGSSVCGSFYPSFAAAGSSTTSGPAALLGVMNHFTATGFSRALILGAAAFSSSSEPGGGSDAGSPGSSSEPGGGSSSKAGSSSRLRAPDLKPSGALSLLVDKSRGLVITVVTMVLAIIAYLGYEIISIGNGWNVPACAPEFVIPVGDREEFLKGFMEGDDREFYVVLGLPNIGKTTTVCKAAKKRPAIYINCYGCVSLEQLRATIASSQSWLLRGLALFSQERSMESLATLASIWRWINRKKVVVIFDHLHSLDSAATRYLLSWAKENVEAKNLVIFLIGSDSSVNLIGTRDSITRGNHVIFMPFSEAEIINGIIDYLKTNKGMKAEAREEDLQQMLKEFVYWFGPCPEKVRRAAVTELKTGNLLQRMPQQAQRNAHGMHGAAQCLIKEEEVDFWYALVSNGRVKINALKYFGIDTKSGQEDPCLQVHDGSVYFRDGLCRDYHILASVERIDQELMMIDKELQEWWFWRSLVANKASLESKKEALESKKKVLEKCRSDHRLETYAPTNVA